QSVLASADVTMDQVIKATMFLVDMADFAACNEVWVSFFGEHRPARTAIAVAALPLGARVEVELWASTAPR
ncbi:MAG TPA: RidA family protein, partial [Acidimicrobiales bacterium]